MKTLPTSPRICVASSGLGHVRRGVEAWADDLASALVRRNLSVVLCKGGGTARHPYERVISCWQRDSIRAQRLLKAMPHALAWRIGLGNGYAIEQTSFALGLIRLLRQHACDVLHVQDPQVALMIQTARTLGLVGTQVILMHGTEEPLEFLKKIEFVQHGAPWHIEEARRAGVWRESWTMIPNFVDVSIFSPQNSRDLRAEWGLAQTDVVVLAASAVKSQHKRIDYLIREFQSLIARGLPHGVVLVIAGGRGADSAELISLAKNLLRDQVRVLVDYPRERMPGLYAAADIFVQASLKEMMPMAVLEATASGLPCVTHAHSVMQWMLGSGGRTIDMQQEGSLSDALALLIASPAQRKQLGAAARHQCMRLFETETVVDQIVHYYQRVYQTGRRHSHTGEQQGRAA